MAARGDDDEDTINAVEVVDTLSDLPCGKEARYYYDKDHRAWIVMSLGYIMAIVSKLQLVESRHVDQLSTIFDQLCEFRSVFCQPPSAYISVALIRALGKTLRKLRGIFLDLRRAGISVIFRLSDLQVRRLEAAADDDLSDAGHMIQFPPIMNTLMTRVRGCVLLSPNQEGVWTILVPESESERVSRVLQEFDGRLPPLTVKTQRGPIRKLDSAQCLGGGTHGIYE